jgi:hypothetical protein
MSSPVAVADSNQFDVLSSPIDEGKSQEGLRSRFGKDDLKEQAYQAREMIKTKVYDLKEQVVNSGIVNTVTSQLQPAIDLVKEKTGITGTNEEVAAEIQDKAEGEWQEVKHKGRKQIAKGKEIVDQELDSRLTKEQRAKLNKGLKQAKRGAKEIEGQAKGFSNDLINLTLSNPRLRPVKSFIQRNNLQLPVVIFGSLFTLWFGLTLIRLVTDVATPKVPEFDIHSKTETMNWLKYHAGEYKDRAIDMKDSLSGRAAAFLANYEFDKLKGRALDYKDIGMNKLGLTEPTWGEWAWAKLTGRPITWQDRVENVLDLTKQGLNRVDLKTGGLFDRVKHMLSPHEPTLGEKASDMYDSIKNTIRPEPTMMDNIKNSVVDGVNTIRSHLPGGESIEAARQRAYEAAHPSTLDQLKNGATYLKNRVVHGAQEAAHIAQDRANEAADKARYKTGL